MLHSGLLLVPHCDWMKLVASLRDAISDFSVAISMERLTMLASVMIAIATVAVMRQMQVLQPNFLNSL